jgi:site-specific DNA-methyltransferase (adenine-specific)
VSAILGDCLELLKQIEDNSIDLIYMDPPFFSQKNHSLKSRDNSREFCFYDTWDSIETYIDFIKNRIVECYRVLKSTGSIFLHCDKSASHYLRIMLDEVFGAGNFRNEIIWTYKRWTNSKKSLQNTHQTILFYSKASTCKFNAAYTDYAVSTNVDQILQERIKDDNGKSAYKTDPTGNVVFGKAKQGVPLGDVWSIPYLNPKANERIGYPTQKPIVLLKRIIEIATEEGDIVLDPFCGSGTALVAAHLLKRNYIGFDISPDAIRLTNERLLNPVITKSNLLIKGEAEYQTKTECEVRILQSLHAVPVQRNGGIDGFLKTEYNDAIIPVKIQKESESLLEARQKLISAAVKRHCQWMVLVKTKNDDYEQTLFQQPGSSDADIFVLESYELSVGNWLDELNKWIPRAIFSKQNCLENGFRERG